MKPIKVPVSDEIIDDLKVGERILISGNIYTGRDAALPKLVKSIKAGEDILSLKGSAIMHTAVSDAGIAPTTSNKKEIEENIHYLANAGVKIHIGKGSLSKKTVKALDEENSIFVITPPAAALLTSKIKSKRVVAFAEEGMEAIFEIKVNEVPGIVAVSHGKSLF